MKILFGIHVHPCLSVVSTCVCVVGLSLCSLQFAHAGQARDRLDRFLSDVKSLSGRFEQEVFDEQGKRFQHASGTLKLARPGRFRWEYQLPSQQLILADGQRLWIFDPELDQATVKPVDEALGAAPIMLLTQSRSLDQDFEIRGAATRAGLDWVELIPKVKDTEFHRIELGLDDHGVRQMDLHDQFGQETVIRFEDVQTNVELPESDFRFEVPPGVDVIGTTQ